MKTLRYDLGIISDPGNRRPDNQDSLIARRGQIDNREFLLLAVADGMGGMARGDKASYTAALLLDQWWDAELPLLLTQQLFSWQELSVSLSAVIDHINYIIRAQSPKDTRSGTTLSLLFFFDGQYLLKHVGDSRIYLSRKGTVFSLTKDQTWCQQEIDQGRLTPEAALTHRLRHVLISALGIQEEYFCQEGLAAAQIGDWFLLCSDGFYNEFPVSSQLFSGKGNLSPQELLEDSLHQIKTGPARDNISAILLHITEGGRRL